MAKDKKEEFNLITISGDEIKIIVDLESVDDLYAEILDDLNANNLYFVGNYGETVTYKGYDLTVIDLKKVIGRD